MIIPRFALLVIWRAAKIFLLVSVLTACQTLQPANCDVTPAHGSLVIFGDSYSDTGNIAIKGAIDFPRPPFHKGSRFSNGPVAVERVAANLDLRSGVSASADPSQHTIACKSGYNFAVGGGNIRGNKPQDLKRQVDKYLDMVNETANSDALFLVMMGGNDVRSLKGVVNATVAEQELDEILEQLFEQLDRLAVAGATKFLIANSGDMGQLPGSIADPDTDVVARLNGYSVAYNDKFEIELGSFKNAHGGPSAPIKMFDLFDAMGTIIADANDDFVNETEACFDIDKILSNPYHDDCIPLGSTKIDNFVFFDSVHATGAAHEKLGEALIQELGSFTFP